jgi:alpha-L-rhamnosidase
MDVLKVALTALVLINLKVTGQQVHEINPELLSHTWTAKWISHPGLSESRYGVYLLRKEFTIPAKPEKFIIHVSADNRYKLYVNGTYVCNGPARGYLYRWNFESVDIASYLHAGKNIITSIVWDFAAYRPLAQVSGQTGLIIQGNSPVEKAVNTDTSWVVYDDISYQPLPVRLNQYYAAGAGEDFRCEKHPWDWMDKDFNTSGWRHAKEVENGQPLNYRGEYGNPSIHLLHQRELPFTEEKMQRFFSIRRSDLPDIPAGFAEGKNQITIPAGSKIRLLFDQHVLTTAYPVLTFSKGRNCIIKLTYAESLFDEKGEKGNRNTVENKEIYGYSDIIHCDGGMNRSYQTLWWRTFRYTELEIETSDEPLVLEDFHSIFTAYPFQEKASFNCDNPLFKEIWNTGWRTQRLCAGETFFDCPYYEQLQYIGDARIQALVSTYVSGDSRFTKNALSAMHDSRLPAGLTQSRYPCREVQIIPTFSLVWVTMVYDYWMLNNDPGFVKSMIPGIMETLNWFKMRLDTTGMLGPLEWWAFADWVDYRDWKNGNAPAALSGHSSIVSLQYVYTLEKAAAILEAFGMKEVAAGYRETEETIKKSVFHSCFDANKGIIADSPEKSTFSQHANILAILTNTFPETMSTSAIVDAILNDKSIAQCTLYFRFYLFEALKKAGQADRFTASLDPWKQMLDTGLTTFAEKSDPTRSDCHAWSASPVYYFLSLVCGIVPAEPGFRSVRVEPRLGDLQHIEGMMPHPSGLIKVRLQKDKANQLSGEIVLPVDVSGVFIWNGEQKALKGGINVIN